MKYTDQINNKISSIDNLLNSLESSINKSIVQGQVDNKTIVEYIKRMRKSLAEVGNLVSIN